MTYHGSQTGWAELFVPIQSIQADAIQIFEPRITQGAFQRLLAIIQYKHQSFTMQGCNFLLPFCKIHEWDSTTGKLVLELSCPSTLYRLKQLQLKCIDLLQSNCHWFQRSQENLTDQFQKFLTQQYFTVYIHGPNPEQTLSGRVWVWNQGAWKKGADTTTFTKGELIKLAIRFQGICMLPGRRNSFRIQHQVVAVYQKQMGDVSSSSSSSSS
jgi:hypothetical protein